MVLVLVHLYWAGRKFALEASPDETFHDIFRRVAPPLPPFEALFFSCRGIRLDLSAAFDGSDEIYARLRPHALSRTIGPLYREAVMHVVMPAQQLDMLGCAEDAASEVVRLMANGWRQTRPPFRMDTNNMVLLAERARGDGIRLPMLDAVLEPYVISCLTSATEWEPSLMMAFARLILRRSQVASAAGDAMCRQRIVHAAVACICREGISEELACILFASCDQGLLEKHVADAMYRVIANTPMDRPVAESSRVSWLSMDDAFVQMPVLGMDDMLGDSDYVPEGVAIDVDRENILASSYDQVMSIVPSNLTPGAVVDVIFLHESGIGAGVMREWMAQTWQELTDPGRGYFEPPSTSHPHVIHPSKEGEVWQSDDFESWMVFAGRMVGLAIRAGAPTGVHLSRALYRSITQAPTEVSTASKMRDLSQLHPDVARSCAAMLAATDQGELDAMMVPGFLVEDDNSLLPGVSPSDAGDVEVTLENRELLVRLVADHYTGAREVCKRAGAAILRGLAFSTGRSDISPSTLRSILRCNVSCDAFNEASGGGVIVPMEELLSKTRVTMPASLAADGTAQATIAQFWNTVDGMSHEQRRKLLRFWTGATSLSAQARMDLVLVHDDAGDNGTRRRLPSSHTCYMQLSVPCCPDISARLRLAIDSCGSIDD